VDSKDKGIEPSSAGASILYLVNLERIVGPTKKYAVVLFEETAAELQGVAAGWLRRDTSAAYFYSKEIDPSGVYFRMILEVVDVPNIPPQDFELHIPHSFVKAIIYSADLKRLGFTAS